MLMAKNNGLVGVGDSMISRSAIALLLLLFSGVTAAQFAAYIRKDAARWDKLVKDAGIKFE